MESDTFAMLSIYAQIGILKAALLGYGVFLLLEVLKDRKKSTND